MRKIGTKIISLTASRSSPLGRSSDVWLDVSIKKEACPLGLAPTASTTVMLALCDALAVCLQTLKGFKPEDFALFHPGGSLGRKLLLKVEDIMRKEKKVPLVRENTPIKKVLVKITQARSGAACVVDNKGRLLGIFTDGDLRRNIEKHPNLLQMHVRQVMTKNPKCVNKDTLAVEASSILEEHKIDEVPVVDFKGRVVGMLDVQDLLEAGIT